MNVERLVKTVELLDNFETRFKNHTFNIRLWHSKRDCGTVGCAVGTAAMDPWFQAEGLYLGPYEQNGVQPMYNGFEMWDAVAAFYDITKDQAKDLFYGPRYGVLYVTKDMVKQRILKLLSIKPVALYDEELAPAGRA